MTPTAVTSTDSKWTHLWSTGAATLCGQSINVNRWTVRPQHQVAAADWCPRCWDRYLA